MKQATDFEQYNAEDMKWQDVGAGNSPQRRFMSRAINLQVEEVDGRNVLDVGCGTGWFLAECLRKNASMVDGVEPSKYADIAKKNIPNARIFKQIFQDFQNDNLYDLISFIMSAEHLADLPTILGKAAMMLSIQGRVIVLTADFDAFSAQRFGYQLTVEDIIPAKERVVETKRPHAYGTTTDIIRSTDYWLEAAAAANLEVIEHKSVACDQEYIAELPQYEMFKTRPLFQLFRYAKPTKWGDL